MTDTKLTQDTINETLAVCKSVILADDLFQSCAEDGIPVSYHQAQGVERISRECVENDGFYTMVSKTKEAGYVFSFFDTRGELTNTININMPVIAKNRKIPKLNWLKQLFINIGYAADHITIKYMHRIVESHIRDGGTWNITFNDDTVVIILKMNDVVKGHYEFHEEVFLGER